MTCTGRHLHLHCKLSEAGVSRMVMDIRMGTSMQCLQAFSRQLPCASMPCSFMAVMQGVHG